MHLTSGQLLLLKLEEKRCCNASCKSESFLKRTRLYPEQLFVIKSEYKESEFHFQFGCTFFFFWCQLNADHVTLLSLSIGETKCETTKMEMTSSKSEAIVLN